MLCPEVTLAVDAAKLSARKAATVLSSVTSSLGNQVQDTNINKSTLHRQREKHRAQKVEEIKRSVQGDEPLTVHWDGKMVDCLSGNSPGNSPGKDHRQAVVLTGRTTDQLLGVPLVPNGSAREVTSAVVKLIREWHVQERVRAMSFDTTNVNTGIAKRITRF